MVFMAIVALAFTGWEHSRVMRLEEQSSTWGELLIAMQETKTGIVIVSRGDDRINKANQEAEELFGYESNGMEGLPVSELVPEAFKKEHNDGYSRAMVRPDGKFEDTSVVPVACMAKRRDGSEVPIVIRLYIGKRGVIALINHNKDSKYLPLDQMGAKIHTPKEQTK